MLLPSSEECPPNQPTAPNMGTRIAGYAPVSDFAPALSCLALRSKLLTPVGPAEGVLTLRSSGTRTRKILSFQTECEFRRPQRAKATGPTISVQVGLSRHEVPADPVIAGASSDGVGGLQPRQDRRFDTARIDTRVCPIPREEEIVVAAFVRTETVSIRTGQ